MIYLVGGYKLTENQVRAWCRPRNLDPPYGQVANFVNDWFDNNGIRRTSLLPCDYHGEPIFLVINDRRTDPVATPDKFEEFKESERARQMKSLMGVG